MIRLAETSRSGKIYVGTDIQKFSASPEQKRYTKVILYADDDEGTYVQWPPETEEIEDGSTLEAKCPWGTEDIARSILESLQASEGRQDFHYRPYDGEKALLGPAVEIGDGITTNGVYSGIYKVVRKFGKHSVSNISAPITSEADHEIQYKSEADRRFIRQAQKVSAEFGLKMDKIYTQVTGENKKFGWTLTQDGMYWETGSGIVMQLTDAGIHVNGSGTFTGTVKADAFYDSSGKRITSATAGSVMGSYASGGFSGGTNFNLASAFGTQGPDYFYVGRSIGVNQNWFTPMTVRTTDYPAGITVLGIAYGT